MIRTTAFAAGEPASSTAAPQESTDLHPGWLLFRGAMAMVFGIVALTLPVATLASLVLVFSAYLLADGVVALIAAVRAAQNHRDWGGAALEGVANLVAGGLALSRPGLTLIALVWVSGFWAIVSGALLAAAGWRSTAPHGRWLRVLAGVLSAVWGLLLLVAPLPGAVVMTFWLGAYAVVFGIALLMAGWRARRAPASPPGSPPNNNPIGHAGPTGRQ